MHKRSTDFTIGQTAYFVFVEFDGHGICTGPITEICKDHVILTDDISNLWLDFDDFGKFWFVDESKAKENPAKD